MTLASRLRQHLHRLLGEEDVTLPAGQGLLALRTCFIPIQSSRRGYRIIRKGDHLTIHRVYPWWERFMLGSELKARATAASYAREFAARAVLFEVGLAYPDVGGIDYCLVANLGQVRSVPVLRGSIRVHGLIRGALLFILVAVGMLSPIAATTVTVGIALDTLPLTWVDLSETLWQAAGLLVGWGGFLVIWGLLLVALVTMIARSRDRGQAGKQALLHFVSVLAAASQEETRS